MTIFQHILGTFSTTRSDRKRILFTGRFLTFLMLLFYGCPILAALPPVVFNSYSSANGLPQNSARTLLQDRDGFMWIGTEDGLVRFDGTSVLSFRKDHDDPNSLSDNYIDALVEDRQGRIWVGTLGGGLNVIDRERQTVRQLEVLANSDIRALLFSDSSEILWVGTEDGLYSIDTSKFPDPRPHTQPTSLQESTSFRKITVLKEKGAFFTGTVSGIIEDGEEIWFCSRGNGVFRHNHKSGKTVWFPKGEAGLLDDTFNTIFRDSSGTIWLGSQNSGLIKVSQTGSTISFIHYNSSNSSLVANDVMAITDGDNNHLWVGTWDGGLYRFEKTTEQIDLYKFEHNDQYSLPSDIIISATRTQNGQIWLGTFDKGACWFNPESPFHTYRKTPQPDNELASNIVWSFSSDEESYIWIGTSKGLARLDLATNQYRTPENYTPRQLWEKVKADDIRALSLNETELWVAARKQGVCKISLKDKTITPLSDLVHSSEKLTHPYVRLILKDSKNQIWFGATKGLNRYNPDTGKIRQYQVGAEDSINLPHYRIRAIFEDHRGQIWVGTSYGLLRIDTAGNPSQIFKKGTREPDGLRLAGNGIRGIGEDNSGRIWLATEGGISVYNPRQKETIILRENDGLPSNSTYCTLWAGGYMWATTLNGLARIDPKTLAIETYTTEDGLPNNEFNFNAWHKLSDKQIAVGTLSGFSLFNPSNIPGPEKVASSPPFYLHPILFLEDNQTQRVSSLNEQIKVDWRTNKISFAYGALNFRNPHSVKYEYQLNGTGDAWMQTDNQSQITFNGLAAGDYSLTMRARDSHNQWTITTEPIHFSIAQAPWKSTGAILIYTTLLTLLVGILFFQYNKRVKKHAIYMESLVTERTGELRKSNVKLKEQHQKLDQLLTSRERFFRAVAHELKTPLAVIMSSLETLHEQNRNQKNLTETIYIRASRMGELLDNLLDYANNDINSSTALAPFAVQAAIDEVLHPFKNLAQEQNKELKHIHEGGEIFLTMRRDTFLLIISNLVTNAFKYTKPGGYIHLHSTTNSEHFILTITDDGVGVSANEKDEIFDWFKRGNGTAESKGWGIGLAFVKDEIEVIGGKIELTQTDTPGAQFILTFPLTEAGKIIKGETETSKAYSLYERGEDHPALANLEKKYTLLIVEDDPDLLQHLPTIFPEHWKKLSAPDVETAITLTQSHLPDIIITDLILPRDSGFDLTKQLKEDPQTAHIPIIILTALGNDENRLTGLGLSADSFLEKPFSNKELLLRVGGLLSNREKVLERTKQILLKESEPKTTTDSSSAKNNGDDFLAKLGTVLREDREISSLSLDEAAKKMAMSKRSLQREMERLGISWREYKKIRRMRLAMDLLREPEKPIGDVADETGYSSVAHFSKIFKDVTGQSPSQWRRNLN